MHRYELLIFDFDGTLADSADWMIRTLNEVAGQFGLRQVSQDEIAMLRGRSNTEIVRYLGVPMWKLPRIAAEMQRRVAGDVHRFELFTGVDELLRSLDEADIRLAIVSSNSEDNVRRILGETNAKRIDSFECSASIFGKAHKLRTVMRRLQIDASRTLSIGDETRDLEAAREVGVASGAVCWGYATPEILARFAPTHTFATLSDIAALVV